ncbi:integral membrane protein [Streptomyces sp. SPB78]|nr:integral membrane protein [Streptomyces sp. SPB78]
MPITKRLFRSALTLTRCNVDRVRTQPTPGRLARLFARLDREPERPANPHVPVMSRHRLVLLLATLAFYLAIVVAVAATTWLVRLDWQLMFFRPYQQWPEVHAFLDYLVVLGQRGPTAVMVLAWLGWRSWRQHTLRPLLVLGASLLLLNITVGAAKIGMGRLGPHYATVIGSNEMGLGGDIFPSGHTANAVVTWGILAYLASTPRARRYLSAGSAIVSLSVGLTTVYLGTHWLSDVVLGWAAGLLVLLALPWCEPLVARAEVLVLRARDSFLRRRAARRKPVPGTSPRPLTPVSPRAVPATATVRKDPAHGPRATVRPEHGTRRPQSHDRNQPRGGSARPLAGG